MIFVFDKCRQRNSKQKTKKKPINYSTDFQKAAKVLLVLTLAMFADKFGIQWMVDFGTYWTN